MKASEYRKQLETEIAARQSHESVTMALQKPDLKQAVTDLADASKSNEVRISSLNQITEAQFGDDSFASHRANFMDALRDIVKDKNSAEELWREALTLLVMENDDFAQNYLSDALTNPGAARIGQAEALRLLGVDDHSNAAAHALRLLKDTEEHDVRTEALHALGSDATAQQAVSDVFTDKKQNVELRKAAGNSLRHIDPALFVKEAIAILNDAADHEDLHAATIGILSNISATLDDATRRTLQSTVQGFSVGQSATLQKPLERLRQRLQDSDPSSALESMQGAETLNVVKKF